MASAYVLYLYELYWSHILDWGLRTQKVAMCVVANTRREILVLVDFQDDYYSISYQIIY